MKKTGRPRGEEITALIEKALALKVGESFITKIPGTRQNLYKALSTYKIKGIEFRTLLQPNKKEMFIIKVRHGKKKWDKLKY